MSGAQESFHLLEDVTPGATVVTSTAQPLLVRPTSQLTDR